MDGCALRLPVDDSSYPVSLTCIRPFDMSVAYGGMYRHRRFLAGSVFVFAFPACVRAAEDGIIITHFIFMRRFYFDG